MSKLSSFITYIIGLIGGLCALIGCRQKHPENQYECMYGSPSAEYIFKGQVTDSEGLPIENVELKFLNNDFEMANASTDEKGEYQTEFINEEYCDITVSASADNYESKDTLLPWKNMEFKDTKGRWFKGVATNTVNISLNEKSKSDD